MEIESVNPKKVEARFHSQEYLKAKDLKAPLVNWLPEDNNQQGEVVMPDASRRNGPLDPTIQKENIGRIVQMVRFGFGRIDSKTAKNIVIYYAHR